MSTLVESYKPGVLSMFGLTIKPPPKIYKYQGHCRAKSFISSISPYAAGHKPKFVCVSICSMAKSTFRRILKTSSYVGRLVCNQDQSLD
ncbi:hypothetical protein GDO86_016608 [Hymenochirus boettgeri]|uniref:Uncharacterized protein n=1 Tax=Hymenochirus boettgeri TaxID=247094 RepID=A0A8T2JXK7_9PIPI|nr:hypothetical protein GDO86_016608 [Hymenochirus boettgeri]